ncbi:BREX-2 system phosphatase PglZ [Streptomyces sp. NPDC058272]|uniref:BREX-2 system phosphatase PglZ n=1 Tax=Streptomyces sp. NPDC058272 TaxID=3346415 RepID=UPI0036F18204
MVWVRLKTSRGEGALPHPETVGRGPGRRVPQGRFAHRERGRHLRPCAHAGTHAIDDRLAKEQNLGDGAWRVDDVPGLRDLLRIAAAQGMAVIVTSDHGHVIDRHGTKTDTTVDPASARHRPPGTGPLAEREIALSGPRVVWPEPGASIVALWDADSRYTALKAGYHGGASLAEFTIPVLAFLPFGAVPPKEWRELGDQRPTWWAPQEPEDYCWASEHLRRSARLRQPLRRRRRRRPKRSRRNSPGHTTLSSTWS